MNRYSFFILNLFLGLLPVQAAAQEMVHGSIIDSENRQPVVGAVVQALNRSGKVISFASSDADGIFKIKFSETADSVSFRCMGYTPMKLPRDYDFSRKVEMHPKATVLKDVIVKAPDIYAKGDTLVFNVSRYAKSGDDAILDVIKRLPGIKVEDDGTIKYQGKPISKFYIDGNDFLEGRYGLATENISHKDVKSVEVMENHQPVKALEGIDFPEEAGINLTLKEDAKSRWVGVTNTSAGTQPMLYDGSVYTMRIAPKIQNVFTLRAGNTGWNPINQMKEQELDYTFSSDYQSSLWPEYISADMVSAPLSEKRTRDNLSWLANAISSWKRGDNSMRLNLNYTGDRLDYNYGLSTTYFSPTITDFIQRNDMRTQAHDLSARFNSEINQRDYYFKDRLTINAIWDRTASAVTGTSDLAQKVNRDKISVSNDLKLVKRNQKRLFELISRNSFYRSPDLLSVEGYETARQSVGVTDLRSTTESRWGKLSRFWKFYVTAGLDLNYHRMNINLSGLPDYDNSGVHNSILSTIYMTPRIDYQRNGWRASFYLPAKWQHHNLNGQRNYVNLVPRISATKTLSSKSEIGFSIKYSLCSPNPYLDMTSPVLADYRHLFIGNNTEKYSHSLSGSLSYKYRNPLNSLFFNTSVIYTYTRSGTMSSQQFVDNIIISSFADKCHDARTGNIKLGISKGLGHSRMVIGCELDGIYSSATSMRDYQLIPYRQLTATAKPYFKGSITRWFSINYEAGYGFSRMNVIEERSESHTLNEKFYATVIPCDLVDLTLGAEHYLTHFTDSHTEHMVLLDASASWRVNNRVRIMLNATNLLNKRHYAYHTYGTLSSTGHTFRLRPRNILATLQYRF